MRPSVSDKDLWEVTKIIKEFLGIETRDLLEYAKFNGYKWKKGGNSSWLILEAMKLKLVEPVRYRRTNLWYLTDRGERLSRKRTPPTDIEYYLRNKQDKPKSKSPKIEAKAKKGAVPPWEEED